jgi:hypothetical protein
MIAAAAQAVQTQISGDGATVSGGTGKAVVREGSAQSTSTPVHRHLSRWIVLGAVLSLVGLLLFVVLSARGDSAPRPASAPAPLAEDAGAADGAR